MKTTSFLRFYQRIFIALSFLFLYADLSFAQPNGEALFQSNCTSCHKIGEVLIGPNLQGVTKRRPKEWLHKWVKNSQAVVKSGDPYAVELFNKFNKTPMTSFNLKDEEIDAILTYIENFKPPVNTPNGPGSGVPG